MRVFFTDRSDVSDKTVVLTGDNYHHIKNVLRLAKGDEILVKTGGNLSYLCSVSEFEENKVICSVKDIFEADTELPIRVSVFQGIPKGDKMELVIQKCTELGASEIIPVMTERSIVRLDDKKKKSKLARWEKVALGASEQSRRSKVCLVSEPVTFEEALAKAADFDHLIFPYECAEGFAFTRKVFSEIMPGESVALFIGPEGGFSNKEAQLAEAAGVKTVTLGRRILRTETAAIFVLSVLGFLTEAD